MISPTTPNFNPRTPCGVRPAIVVFLLPTVTNFNPRTPCGVRRAVRRVKRFQDHFNPRTPCGVRPISWPRSATKLPFQSTHPMRGATERHCPRGSDAADFNPRTPCGVRHDRRDRAFQRGHISIHAPHAGCDLIDKLQTFSNFISIHAPHAGCDAVQGRMVSGRHHFNPRTPCGVRLRLRYQHAIKILGSVTTNG